MTPAVAALLRRAASLPRGLLGLPVLPLGLDAEGHRRSRLLDPALLARLALAVRDEHAGDGEPGMTGLAWRLIGEG